MIRVRLICRRCGERFEKDVHEPGEAEQKKQPSYPVRCPKCGGPVERA
jgi:DNA-directed RNA polymerase subunit RPC12/RpoP